jgi:NADH-quinone oxidoreductase subunit I
MAMEMLKGLGTTIKEFGKKPTTVSYPEEKRPLPARFRGRHVLHRYEGGLERCVGCYLCAGACPADAIYIEAEENTDEHRVSPGERYARVFDVNLLRCIFCGYCEQACPTGAITLENIYELATTHPEDLVYHKEQLLEPVGSATAVMLAEQIAFVVLAVVAVASALGVVLFRNAVYSMLSLIVNLMSIAGFFLMLQSIFVATIQVLIYAGAVMVLFLFVVTMLAPDQSDTRGRDRLAWQWGAGFGLGFILSAALIVAMLNGSIASDAKAAGASGLAEQVKAFQGSTEAFGMALFHGYSFPFEVTSLLLVVAVLGAVVLGRRIASRE